MTKYLVIRVNDEQQFVGFRRYLHENMPEEFDYIDIPVQGRASVYSPGKGDVYRTKLALDEMFEVIDEKIARKKAADEEIRNTRPYYRWVIRKGKGFEIIYGWKVGSGFIGNSQLEILVDRAKSDCKAVSNRMVSKGRIESEQEWDYEG